MKFLNIANFHAFHFWRKRILSCNDKTFFLHFSSLFCFCNVTFFYSSYIITPPQPSSAIYGAPPFTGNRFCASVSVGPVMSHGSQMFLPFRSYVNLMVVLSMMWLTHYDHQLNAVHDVNLLFIYLEHKIKRIL